MTPIERVGLLERIEKVHHELLKLSETFHLHEPEWTIWIIIKSVEELGNIVRDSLPNADKAGIWPRRAWENDT